LLTNLLLAILSLLLQLDLFVY